MSWGENKLRGAGGASGWVKVFSWVGRLGLALQVAPAQSDTGEERAMQTREKSIPGRGNSECKGPVARTRQEPV